MTRRFVVRARRLSTMIAFAVLAFPLQQAAAQCGGTQLCGPGTGDCTVSAACTLTLPATGLDIDLGSRRLVITRELRVNGPAGAGLTVRAGDFLLDGATILLPGQDGVAGSLIILSASHVTIRNAGVVDANAGLAAGLIDLEALAGNLSITGRISANGTGTRSGIGGDILLLATGSATVNGARVDVAGGDLGGAGSVAIEALTGSVAVGAPLKAFGADGGDIEISAGTTLQTLSTATLDVDANGDAGSGGTIDLSAFGDITIGGAIVGAGAATDFRLDGRAGGDGADIDVFSETGSVALGASTNVHAAPGGVGGTVDILAGGNLTLTRPVLAYGDGIDGTGGNFFLTTDGTLSVTNTLDVRGLAGTGGSIDAQATGNLEISGSLTSNGDTQGGSITLAGCVVNVLSTGSVSSRGPGTAPSASNELFASSTMTIAGTLQATTRNVLSYRQAPAPSVTGSVTPPATVNLQPTLPCCISCPVTTTTTTTSTTTTRLSTTTIGGTTTTTTLPSICGNGSVTGTEQCDDGNRVGGDCCSPTCTFESSGAPCADDANPCTRDVCSAAGACTHPAGNAGTTCRVAAGICDQAEACTGTATTCPPDVKLTTVCRGAAGACDVAENCNGVGNTCPPDGFATATTSCRAAAGICDQAESCTGSGPACPADQFVAAGSTCRAAAGVCDVAETCTGVSATCPTNGFVADGTTCGAGSCSVSGRCQGGVCTGGTPVTCGSCETCNPLGGGCVAAPKPACLRPAIAGKARFKLRDALSGPRSDLVLWKWVNGAATTLGDFGDPVTSDDLTLCVFDRSQATSSLLFRATVPAGGTCGTRPCWVNNGRTIRFKNISGEPDGVVGLVLTPGQTGQARIQFKGKGTPLTDRPLGLPTPPLPVPMTVQLQSENGHCWEANYIRPGVRTNDGQTFDGAAE